ncbi:S-adenosyl methyltransferase [Nocardia pseudobrasiliensis]|uniref:S-adenosyl methyltransferase n=1 Tax=Nocardia pseudobrasiliensis TaxID=45979 RepID=A0A370HK67_9NOCA|nr:S-adenosyl methyltransferase [Nocardia pseudobrasiliensis]
MSEPSRVLTGVDASKPNAARVYDYVLGGGDNYAVDRAFAEEMLTIAPDNRALARYSRQFLLQAVALAADAGVRQFIDLGAGIPNSPNVHEVAQKIDPSARVVSIDYDPVVYAYANAYLSGAPGVTSMLADVRDPDDIIDRLREQALIDFDQPVAILLVGVLHFVMDDEHPAEIIARLRSVMVSGSYLVFTHVSDESDHAFISQSKVHTAGSSAQGAFRSRAEMASYFDGFEFLAPGLVPVQHWLDSEAPATKVVILGGVCRMP